MSASTRTVPARMSPAGRVQRTLRDVPGRAASTVVGVMLALLALLAVGLLTGHRVLVDRGDSMRPALRAGDLLVNRTAPAERIAVGDIVTFDEPGRDRSVTHRVVARRLAGPVVGFTTRGDANSNGERWSARRGEEVGRLVASVPVAGFVIGFLVSPPVRLALTVLCAGAFGLLALRWIWRDDRPAPRLEPRPDSADNDEDRGVRSAATSQ